MCLSESLGAVFAAMIITFPVICNASCNINSCFAMYSKHSPLSRSRFSKLTMSARTQEPCCCIFRLSAFTPKSLLHIQVSAPFPDLLSTYQVSLPHPNTQNLPILHINCQAQNLPIQSTSNFGTAASSPSRSIMFIPDQSVSCHGSSVKLNGSKSSEDVAAGEGVATGAVGIEALV